MQERDIEKYLKRKMEEAGGVARKFKTENRRGVPDRICIMAPEVIFFVECKAPRGKLSSLQEMEIELLHMLGCRVEIVRSRKDVDFLINKMKGITAERIANWDYVYNKLGHPRMSVGHPTDKTT